MANQRPEHIHANEIAQDSENTTNHNENINVTNRSLSQRYYIYTFSISFFILLLLIYLLWGTPERNIEEKYADKLYRIEKVSLEIRDRDFTTQDLSNRLLFGIVADTKYRLVPTILRDFDLANIYKVAEFYTPFSVRLPVAVPIEEPKHISYPQYFFGYLVVRSVDTRHRLDLPEMLMGLASPEVLAEGLVTPEMKERLASPQNMGKTNCLWIDNATDSTIIFRISKLKSKALKQESPIEISIVDSEFIDYTMYCDIDARTIKPIVMRPGCYILEFTEEGKTIDKKLIYLNDNSKIEFYVYNIKGANSYTIHIAKYKYAPTGNYRRDL